MRNIPNFLIFVQKFRQKKTTCNFSLQQKERAEGRMGPPKDRLAAMQANAYFDDDDSFNIPVDEEQEGKP
jgi:hypothetical protein